jgi:hypothetical protein
MYYVAYNDDDGRLHISQKRFTTLDNALSYAASIAPSRKAKVLEEFKNLSQRVVFRPKPKAEPVWRDLKTEDKPVLTGKENLAELLRQKLNYRPNPIE